MRFLPLFFFFLLCTSSVLAIGISPPLVKADYEEGLKYEFNIKLINNGAPGVPIKMSSGGSPLSKYVSFSEDEFVFESKYKDITVTATFPAYNDLESFGEQKILLFATENVAESGGMMAVATSVEGWFIVDIPLPGKYVVIDSFSIQNTNEGYNALAKAVIRNRGTQPLSDLSARLDVTNYKGDLVDSFLFNDISIPVDDSYAFEEYLPTKTYDSSKYFATIEINYDSEKKPAQKATSFFMGSTDVELLGYTENISSGTINKIRLELQSLWGSPLKNIRGSIELNGVSQPLPVLDFTPFEQKHLDTFLDVPETNDTAIDATLTLTIPVDETTEETKTFPLRFEIVEEQEPVRESPLANSSAALIGVILIVILLGAVNIVFFMRKKHEKKN
ncbi:MAG: hypothetical protein KC535_01830 [Nanoarchaeota archaeon]|nr:hypothetical protein [Nanoarchaeota archaeon]